MKYIAFLCICLCTVFVIGDGPTGFGGEKADLRVGVARLDITPVDPSGLNNLWEHPFKGIHDRIYARVIVLNNGESTAAIVAVDTVEFADATPMVQRVAKETGIPPANIIMAATHDHNSPMVSLANTGASRKAGPGAAAWISKVENDLISGVRQAQANLRPGRVGVGYGKAYVNINRSERTENGWIRGVNPDGPSDKTVWVVKFESASGEPIAFLINYAVHGVVMEPENDQTTGDLPGATSRFVEQRYNDKVVALWTMGSAGDQNPVYMDWDTVTLKARKPGWDLVNTLGHMLGQEVVRVAENIKQTSPQARIWAAEKIVTCPGQKRDPEARKRGEVKFLDSDPVSFRLGLLMINRIALAVVSGEVVTNIYWRLRRESPFTDTILVTLANGRIGYINDDAAYDRGDLEVAGTPLKRGCAEQSIVSGFLELMEKY